MSQLYNLRKLGLPSENEPNLIRRHLTYTKINATHQSRPENFKPPANNINIPIPTIRIIAS